MPDANTIERFTQGECHVLAAASVLLHGGSFLVAFNAHRVHWEAEEGDVHEVLHVYARLPSDGGVVLRDILGDRPEDYSSVRQELEEMFPGDGGDCLFEEMVSAEVLGLIGDPCGHLARALGAEAFPSPMDHDDRPLIEIGSHDLHEAMSLPEVSAPPGTRPLIAPPFDVSLDL